MPLFTTTQVQQELATLASASTGTAYMEVFTEFPSDLNKISEGFYVARVYQADRTVHSNGITPGGHVYWIKDVIEMYIITQQVNAAADAALGIFPAFIDDALFQGYFQREHIIEQQYVKNSERYKVVFNLTRLQTI